MAYARLAQLARRRSAPPLVLAVIVVAALVVRWQLVDIQSGDYRAFLDPWYRHLAENGGFAALKDTFSNYNTPYLVLLAAVTYLPIPQIVAIKLISVVFDLVLAGFVYKIVARLRPAARWLPTLTTGVVLFAPTVVMNGSAWGQCDSIYAACCVGSLYFLITRRPWPASVFFGIAFAFKLQAVFFLPVLVVALILNKHRLHSLAAVPVAFFAMLTPALVAGRGLLSQLAVYPAQVTGSNGVVGGRSPQLGGRPQGGGFGGGPGGPGGGAGLGNSLTNSHSFTYNAPTPYAWLPADASSIWKYAGLALAAAFALAFGVWLLRRRRSLRGAEILFVAAAATLAVPLLLPEMHERYFYLAEVLLIVAAAIHRRFWVAAVCIQVASVATYLAYLTNTEYVPLELSAVIAFVAAAAAVVTLVLRLRTSPAPSRPATVLGDPENSPDRTHVRAGAHESGRKSGCAAEPRWRAES